MHVPRPHTPPHPSTETGPSGARATARRLSPGPVAAAFPETHTNGSLPSQEPTPLSVWTHGPQGQAVALALTERHGDPAG